MKNSVSHVAQLFVFARTQLNLSVESMAIVLQASKATVSRIEHGTAMPTPRHFANLARVTGHTPSELAEAMHNRSYAQKPMLEYMPGLPNIENASLAALEAIRVFLQDDINKLSRKIAKRKGQLQSQQACEEVRSIARPKAEKYLKAQQRMLRLLQESGADEEMLALQRTNVEAAQTKLNNIPGEHPIREGQLVYQSLKLHKMQAELDGLQADLARTEARMKALKASAPAEDQSPRLQRGTQAAVATADNDAAPAAHESLDAGRSEVAVPPSVEVGNATASSPRTRGTRATPMRGTKALKPAPAVVKPEAERFAQREMAIQTE